jgi:Sec-independent protein secretion pathway component TatC
MSVGLLEVALLAVVFIAALLLSVLGQNWFYLGIVPMFGIAVIVTPADPVSCLVVGVPAILIYAWTVHRMQSRNSTEDH